MDINLSIQRIIERVLWLLTSGVVVFSCANIIAPEGGERDVTPPQLIEETSTPNYQTNFEKQPITLSFDEWIVLEDVFNQVLVSPPLDERPEVKIKKRSIVFKFAEEETLRPDATYTINFGQAVKDLNEKNPAEDLRFVFSTGDIIDSLYLRALVIDAKELEPVEGALFMLYDQLADSVFIKERPFYFSITDENGEATIRNVKSDTFKVTVLTDQNVNYLYDQPTEAIAFLDSNIILTADSMAPLVFYQFAPALPAVVEDASFEDYGLVKLLFNEIPDSFNISTSVGLNLLKEQDRDTLKYWYTNENAPESWKFLIQVDTLLFDTVNVKTPARNTLKDVTVLGLPNRKIKPGIPQLVTFNYPIESVDTSFIEVLEDTTMLRVFPQVQIDSQKIRSLQLTYNWKEGIDYEVKCFPGAVTDIFGRQNQDTIAFQYSVSLVKAFGNIKLFVSNLDTTQTYKIEIVGSNDKIETSFVVADQSYYQNTITLMDPGKYILRIIEDRNRNQQWDTGNYDQGLQPERLMLYQMEQLRANWDLEVKVPLNLGYVREEVVEEDEGN